MIVVATLHLLLIGAPPSVVGSWALMGQPFATFDKNGSCTMDEEPCTWRISGNTLFITGEGETEALPFSLAGNVLTLTVNGIPVALEKAGKSSSTSTPAAPPAANPWGAPAAGASAGAGAPGEPKMDLDDPLAKLLLSSAWCTFWFNKTTGYSGSTRSVLFPDGTYQAGGKSEGYSSGYGGTMASESRTGSSGRWAVSKGRLWMTPERTEMNPQPPLVPITDLVITRNSNGSPILKAAGTEYSQCQ